jgi:hypothetical protein
MFSVSSSLLSQRQRVCGLSSSPVSCKQKQLNSNQCTLLYHATPVLSNANQLAGHEQCDCSLSINSSLLSRLRRVCGLFVFSRVLQAETNASRNDPASCVQKRPQVNQCTLLYQVTQCKSTRCAYAV